MGSVPHPNACSEYGLAEVAADLADDRADLEWRLEWILTHDGQEMPDGSTNLFDVPRTQTDGWLSRFRFDGDFIISKATGGGSQDDGLVDMLSGWWEEVSAADVALAVTALAIIAMSNQREQEADRGFWGDLEHNFGQGNSLVGAFITRRYSPEVIQRVLDDAPEVTRTIHDAAYQISTLNPSSFAGAQLLVSDPAQFAETYVNFGAGVADWTVDTGKLAGAFAIASNPVLNAQYAGLTGTNVRSEIDQGLRSAVLMAANDPDAFVAAVVDWEGLQQDPIRWAGNQAPEVVLEVLTGGAATAGSTARRGANLAGDVAEQAADVARGADNSPTGRLADESMGQPGGFLEQPLGPSEEVIGDVRYNEFGEAVSVDANRLFEATDVSRDPVLADPALQQSIADAWLDSVDRMTPRENGGWIIENADGTFRTERWPSGGPSDIGVPTQAPDNVAGAFHTHPNKSGLPRPSRKDVRIVEARPEIAPHYVVSHEGIWVIDVGGIVTNLG